MLSNRFASNFTLPLPLYIYFFFGGGGGLWLFKGELYCQHDASSGIISQHPAHRPCSVLDAAVESGRACSDSSIIYAELEGRSSCLYGVGKIAHLHRFVVIGLPFFILSFVADMQIFYIYI